MASERSGDSARPLEESVCRGGELCGLPPPCAPELPTSPRADLLLVCCCCRGDIAQGRGAIGSCRYATPWRAANTTSAGGPCARSACVDLPCAAAGPVACASLFVTRRLWRRFRSRSLVWEERRNVSIIETISYVRRLPSERNRPRQNLNLGQDTRATPHAKISSPARSRAVGTGRSHKIREKKG